MPELPEVETVRRGLDPVMAGQRFLRVEQRRPDLRFPFPERFAARLEGTRVERLERRAKYLRAHLSTGEVLVMHLGMTGRFTITSAAGSSTRSSQGERRRRAPTLGANGSADAERVDGKLGEFVHDTGGDPGHDHVVFEMSGGARITYNDPRRFGYMELIAAPELDSHPHFAGLGVEPLGPELTAGYLASRAMGRAVDLKAFLLDQRIVAGLGNIYVCEALFRAGLSPKRGAACLADRRGRPTERATRLVPIIRSVLDEAIAAGGSTLKDYRHADGSPGYFQHSFAVYDREGETCVRTGCGGTVRRTVQAGRSSFYCPACQR